MRGNGFIPQELKAGPFFLAEALAAGLPASALKGPQWRRLGARLYCWKDSRIDTWKLVQAWHRVVPQGAVFVGLTAAWLHRLDLDPNPVEVAVAPPCELRSRKGLIVWRSSIGPAETTTIRGLPTTTLHRTLLDLCARRPAVEALIAIDAACRTGRHWNVPNSKPRPGSARLRRLAKLAAPAESPMETRLRWLLISAGLPQPEVQVDLHDDDGEFLGRADLYYRRARLVIEYDGANHRERLVSDDRRQNLLINAGYRILRFTAADIHGRPEVVAAQVRGSI